MKLKDESFNDVYIVTHILKDGSVCDSMADMVLLYNDMTSPAYDVLKECIFRADEDEI